MPFKVDFIYNGTCLAILSFSLVTSIVKDVSACLEYLLDYELSALLCNSEVWKELYDFGGE